MRWIYLKSNNPADALAMASVLAKAEEKIGIVRRSVFSPLFSSLQNVEIDFYKPDKENLLIEIDQINSDLWDQKCTSIASKLGIKIDDIERIIPIGISTNSAFERLWGNSPKCLLYFYPHPDQHLDLMIIDKVVRILEEQGINSVSGGSISMPCIRGTQDMRNIINIPTLISLKDKISFVITSEKFIHTICQAINIKCFVIKDNDGLTINEIKISEPSQITNYITNHK